MRTHLLILAFAAAGCAATTTERLALPPLPTVASVELPQYLGTWYEIASIPQRFQKGCTATTATYSLRPDGQIDVLNKCRLETVDGREKIAHGTARIVDTRTNARLEVSFFRPFWGEYWVIDLAPDYAWAVVGHPSRDYLWILSRTPQLSPDDYQGIVERLEANGYDLSRLQKTVQVKGAARSGDL
jgi:apolipoprotein D and lipocalin family protein